MPLNDLIVDGKKVSGNAQTRKSGVILQHGTILLNVDVEKMFELLLIPNEKIKDKMIATVKDRVTSLSSQLGREFGFDEAVGVFERGYARFFDQVEFVESEVTEEEDRLAKQYAEEKYSDEQWLFKM